MPRLGEIFTRQYVSVPFIRERKAAKNLSSARWKFMKIDEIASFSVSFGQENLLRGRPTEIINFQLAAVLSVCWFLTPDLLRLDLSAASSAG